MHYHSNAKSNINQRTYVKTSTKSNRELATELRISHVTAGKWKNRENAEDASCRPRTIHYALSKADERILLLVRKRLAASRDELFYLLEAYIPNLGLSNIYRTLKRYGANKLSTREKQKAKQFATYNPGFLHIDILKLPSFNGKKYYCFLAIERVTRLIYLEVYERQTGKEAVDFLAKCLDYFPVKIHTILTDNGRQFSMKGQMSFGKVCTGETSFEALCSALGITYRKTKPFHPWTNGMAERCVRTVKEHTIRVHRYPSAKEMIRGIHDFNKHHNLYRRLKVLDFKTPLQVAIRWYETNPEYFIFNPSDLETIS
jgi:transposase-like protein